MKEYKIGIIPGDGIGRDVIRATQIVLDTIATTARGYTLEFLPLDAGETAIEKTGKAFPQETVDGINKADAVLFGASHTPGVIPGFKNTFDLYANVRPIKALPGTDAIHPHADFIIVRENSEGLFSRVGWIDRGYHVDCRVFTTKGMERIIRFAFEYAEREGRSKVTFTHKAHVLKNTDEPMRKLFYEMANDYPKIEAHDLTVDHCGMEIVMHPERLDVVLTENSNGDILSDVGAGVIGGIGFAAGGNIGFSKAVFEPIHGTAPKYAEKDIVNPSAAILAAKMMFDYLGERDTGSRILQALKDVLTEGNVRTHHMGGTASTTAFAEAVAQRMRESEAAPS